MNQIDDNGGSYEDLLCKQVQISRSAVVYRNVQLRMFTQRKPVGEQGASMENESGRTDGAPSR